jgi:peroxiredoxin Q/BCP
MSLTLSIGDKAPDFNLLDQYGKNISLSSFLGNELAIFFYPKDNTPTCTTEVCNLRDYYADLKNEGIEVVGISPDSVKSHLNFATKPKLRLISCLIFKKSGTDAYCVVFFIYI